MTVSKDTYSPGTGGGAVHALPMIHTYAIVLSMSRRTHIHTVSDLSCESQNVPLFKQATRSSPCPKVRIFAFCYHTSLSSRTCEEHRGWRNRMRSSRWMEIIRTLGQGLTYAWQDENSEGVCMSDMVGDNRESH